MLRTLAISAGIVSGLYVLLVMSLFLAQRHLIYPVPPLVPGAPAGFETVWLETADRLRIHAAYRRGRDAIPTVLFLHGNGDDLRGANRATAELAAAGLGVLLLEYRGYGGNPGTPSERGLYRDGQAALTWLAAHGVPESQLVLVGNSLGSGVATELAANNKVAALILVSAYTALPDVAADHYPWLPVRWLIADRFDNAAKLPRVKVPILLLHGDRDDVIPIVHAERLAQTAGAVTLQRVPGAGHELAYLPQAQARALAWLEGAGVLPKRRDARKDEGGAYCAACASPSPLASAVASQAGTIASPSASTRRSSTISARSE